ncbi:papain-like cysteine protease family protein [Streptomyces sp. XD-27]|uniref:papain-like cysteine protease family protein n=1 Tax=Streptomyces sp. XD-27 TaxID=3062779 RepID=UPI0026F427C2|nr:papain-like cysteine protease family protein [Streptomyces sp. XD-27]WKX72156.1 papain-like cysteine protease family protein [Streptomyces sp. XD-27]
MMHKRRTPRRKKALIAAITAALSGGLLYGFSALAQADEVSGTVIGGQGNYKTINHRAKPSLSAQVNGSSKAGDKIQMSCRTNGDTVENNPRWIYTGSYYIADAFIDENTTALPVCGSNPNPKPTQPNPGTNSKTLKIDMQKQVRSQWCWDASGVTIAKFWGRDVSQERFCQLAAQSGWVDCNNQPATLEDMAGGLARLGLSSSGRSLNRNASFSESNAEIAAGRPFAVRFGWRSGGGHMNVIYGYDSTSNMIAVGDPWQTTQTYTWWNYSTYVNNNSFQWTHSRIGIQG